MNSTVFYLATLLWFILWIVAFVDCIESDHTNKVRWGIAISLLPFLGAFLYLTVGRRH
jgi:hypothetical protein